MSLFTEINAKMQGRVALLSEDEAAALVDMVKGAGDHIDLGTLWGGTAILAALAKRAGGFAGHIYTVDYMQGGYWNTGDPSVGMKKPTEAAIHANLARFGVADLVTVIKANTYPWPVPERVQPVSVLIDCDHSYEGCLRDWEKVRSLKPLYVAFHDYNAKTHPGVARVVDEIRKEDEEYAFFKQAGTLIVFQHLPSAPAWEVPDTIKAAPGKIWGLPVVEVEDMPAPFKAPTKFPVKPARKAPAKVKRHA